MKETAKVADLSFGDISLAKPQSRFNRAKFRSWPILRNERPLDVARKPRSDLRGTAESNSNVVPYAAFKGKPSVDLLSTTTLFALAY